MQTIVSGISCLPKILNDTGKRKLFVVSDSSYPFLNIRDIIDNLKCDKTFFSDFTPNPLFEQACNGLDKFISSGCDSILAIGGGSSIDVAKCIKLSLLSTEGRMALIPPSVTGTATLKDNISIPLIAIPTTAGTGSESTHNAVIYYQGTKQTVADDHILPDYAILEPSVLTTLPSYQKKSTMMDALCQCIESWWSINATTESIQYSKRGIELIMANWKSYIFSNTYESAAQVMLGANYSGRAINIAQTTAAHAMSYKITSIFKLPHGHAVAVCLPEIWEYMLSYDIPVFTDIANALGQPSVPDAISAFREMKKDLKLDNPVSKNRKLDIEIMSESVNPIRLKNNPVPLSKDVLLKLYDIIVE